MGMILEIVKKVALAAEIEENEKKYNECVIKLKRMCEEYMSKCFVLEAKYKQMKEERDYAEWQLRQFYKAQKHSKVNKTEADKEHMTTDKYHEKKKVNQN